MDGSTFGPVEKLGAILDLDNIAEHLPPEDLATIGSDVVQEHGIDYSSMKDWRERMERGLDLAALVKKEKTYPWKGAANLKYPLITTAALQFNARAYPAIVPSDDVVKVQVHGNDTTGAKAARGERVGQYMSFQLSSEVEEWEETTDELLTVLPIVGTVVRKVWFDPVENRNRVRLIDPRKFVVNASVKVLADAPRVGEEIELYPSEIKSRRLSGFYRDVDYVENAGEDREAVQTFIEQHRRLDLDGDGYGEPYIVTVHKQSQKVARIVADFEQGDVKLGSQGVVAIRRGSYFIPYHMLPPIEGGFFGTGLGFLLGDISETINTIINMMIDAGHMASQGGGWIGSEFRLKGGVQQFQPGEWKLASVAGGDIRNSLIPMTFPGPDATLFQLLGLLIEAGKEVASVKDVMTGDTGGRNMTATTTLALIEQGMTVFTAAYKRIYRSLKKEFKLFARLNQRHLDPQKYSAFHDIAGPDGNPMLLDPRREFDLSDMDITPVADPRSVTKMQEAAKAEVLMQMADKGLVDRGEASARILQASSIPDTEALAPKPDPMQQEMMQIQMQVAKANAAVAMVSVEQAMAGVEKTRSETMKNVSDAAAKQATVRLDQLRTALETIRDGLGETLGRGPSGMAGAPDHGPAIEVLEGEPLGAAPGGNVGLLGGNALAGGGAPLPDEGGSPMGGPF